MTTHPAAAVIARWFEEVWNQGRTATIDELFAPEGVARGLAPGGAEVRGPAGFKPFYQRLKGAFPDIRVTIEETIAEGEKAAVRWSATMTHRGDTLGIAPTNRRVRTNGMCFCRVANGRIIESWDNWDALGLMQQLGAGPEVKML